MYKAIITILLSSFPLIIFAQPWEPNDGSGLRPEITKIIEEMVEFNHIFGMFVGPAAYTYPQYKNFEKLLSIATDEELILLTNYPNPVIRGYAFWGLARRNSNKTEQILRTHINDSELVKTHFGCSYSNNSVVEFMLSTVTPDKVDDCLKLPKKVRKQVSRKINEQ